jgi:hypothetical protein
MQIGEFTNAELFSEMSSDDLQSAACCKSNNCHGGPRTTGERFLQSMDAITKGMAPQITKDHSNDRDSVSESSIVYHSSYSNRNVKLE